MYYSALSIIFDILCSKLVCFSSDRCHCYFFLGGASSYPFFLYSLFPFPHPFLGCGSIGAFALLATELGWTSPQTIDNSLIINLCQLYTTTDVAVWHQDKVLTPSNCNFLEYFSLGTCVAMIHIANSNIVTIVIKKAK